MKLIIGLGNPGQQYKHTRHNIGFMFLDYLKKQNNLNDFTKNSKFLGEISENIFLGDKVFLLKPTTYMNLSGDSIKKILDFYKIPLENIIIIYDDKDMNFGKIRYRDKGSSGGHNGIKSIIKYFGDNFKRIKIGIGYNKNYRVEDWVLSKFSNEEIEKMPQIFKETEKKLFENL